MFLGATHTHSVTLGAKMPFPLGPQMSQRKECLRGSVIFTHRGILIHILCELGMHGLLESQDSVKPASSLRDSGLLLWNLDP